jgi:hypothetical protein
MHLEMEFSVPAVGEQPFFLRRQAAGAVHGREVLRHHDATLQLFRARILAAREIHHAALHPELFPALRNGVARHLGVRQRARRRVRRKFD